MSSLKEFDHLRIGLEDIQLATNNFSGKNVISAGGSGKVYKGLLPLRPEGSVKLVAIKRFASLSGQGMAEFETEVMVLSRYKHGNIVSLVGFCDEVGERVLVYEFLSRGSLDRYLSDADLTWLMRLQICLGAARGLSYLHNPHNTQQIILHRDVKSSNILLDEKWHAKMSDFGLSKIGPTNQLSFLVSNSVGTFGYADPLYFHTGLLTKESDTYSFGVVLFEVLCGRLAVTWDDDNERRFLAQWACRHYEQGTIAEIIDPILRKQMNPDSLHAFSSIAYRCLNREREKRPSMLEVVEELEKALGLQQELKKVLGLQQELEKALPLQQNKGLEQWKIPLDDIRKATDNFNAKNLIGGGGFGGVYKAELFHFDVRKVAVKRLDRRYGQGKDQFLQEIKVLSRLQHQNLVPLLGFCHEDNEMILVYEHAHNGSLDRCIRNTHTVYSHTWAQRLQICIDVAHGLNYLHDNDVIHRDIKTANVLLGRNLEGMIGDFGLSRISKLADNEYTMTNVAGTIGYAEPSYARTGKLTKRSDIYSFGVVLLEVLCGRLAVLPKFGDDPEYLLHMFKRHFEQKTVLQSIDHFLLKGFEKGSPIPENFLNSIYKFADVTYKCLYGNQAQNLTIAEVLSELLRAQTFHVTSMEILF